jgi:hypothetical protein
MASRFVARWQNSNKYCVWDTKIDAVAKSADGRTRYESLEFNNAIDTALELNGRGRTANDDSTTLASDQKRAEKR